MAEKDCETSRGDIPDCSDKSAEEARARVEQFGRLTAQETQKIRYSARIRITTAISQETLILHRKLAAIIERTQDVNIRRLLKALHQRYLCLDIKELCTDEDIGFIEKLVEKANAYLARIAATAKTDLNPTIYMQNGFVLVCPTKGHEPVYVIDNEETRKTMHYDGAKIAKPVPVKPVPEPAQKPVKGSPSRKPQAEFLIASTSPEDSREAVPEERSYLQCLRENRDKFKGEKSEMNYRIAEAIALAADNPSSDSGDEDGTTIHELEKTLKVADHTIAGRLGTVGRIFKRIGITLDIEEVIADADMDKAAENSDENYFYRITIFWTSSLEYDSETTSAGRKKGKKWGRAPSRGNVENMEAKEDPNDIFPAFRNVKFITAVQFNETIVEALMGDAGICTYERNASSDDAKKLLRSINACEMDDSIKDRVEEWKRKLFLGIRRCRKYGCLYRGAVSVLLRGINVEDDEA